MLPYTPPVDVVYPAIGVEKKVEEATIFTIDELNKYNEVK